jgi:glycosyltransferase involved in cell wall biosynthesis
MSSKEKASRRHCMVVFAPYPLGETRVQREAEALVSHGYEVDVICVHVPGEATVDEHQGVRIYREEYRFPIMIGQEDTLVYTFLAYIRFFLSAAVRLTRLHRQRSYNTIQVHNLPDFLVFCTLLPKLGGVPIILDLHDLMPEFYAGRFGKDGHLLLRRLILWQEKWACRFADHVITVSEHWRQALIKRGVPASKCSVVMNVADEKIFSSEGDRSRSRDDNQFRLIYHGAIVYRYGLDLAIRAVGQVRRDIPNIHLTILGWGEYVPALKQLTQELELGDHVAILQGLAAEQLPEVIRAADVGIVPYRNDVFTDGLLPTKLMEYGAMGLPCIAARTTAIQTYFGDTMVEFFEPGNVDDLARCIGGLYNSPERLKELAEGSKTFNQRYNWTKIGAEYADLVARLATRG